MQPWCVEQRVDRLLDVVQAVPEVAADREHDSMLTSMPPVAVRSGMRSDAVMGDSS